MKTLNRARLGAALMLAAGLISAGPAAALDLLPSFKSTALEVWAQNGESVQLDTWRALGENRNPKSDHPWQVSPVLLSSLLAQLRVAEPSGSQTLLNAAQIERVAAPLAAALGKADARLDVVFAVQGASGVWTRGRACYVDGQLNVIVGGRGAEDRAGERGRAARGAPTLAAGEQTTAVRADWVQLPVQQIALTAAAPVAIARTAALEAENARLKTELAAREAPAPAAPAAVLAPVAVPTLQAPAKAAAAPVAASSASVGALPTPPECLGSVKQRLAAIDALRADGTISPEEQRAQRKRILDEL